MKNRNYTNNLNLALLSLTAISAFGQSTPSKPNILFIAVDDLKPILGCYGDKLIKTPNIDRIAKNGTVFLSNYCQQAVSGPTRASIMTGMRPDYTGVWDLKTKMRDVNPDILSLPQYLITQGYSTQGIGKIYDQRCVDKKMDAPSWSVPYYNYFKTQEKYYSSQTGMPALGAYQLPQTKELAEKYRQEAVAKGIAESEIEAYISKFVKPSVECVDVPDNAYNDGANVLRAKEILAQLKTENKPFFFAVGFSKPHLPFVSPKKYWDLYKRDQMPVAEFQEMSKNGLAIAYHNAGELRQYSDIPALTEFTDQKDFGLTLPLDKQRELIHGYYAAVSYTDAQIGSLLNTMDSLGLLKNTIVILWGDHGWHLGDHNIWCKHTNFEQATKAPLIISAPWLKPSNTASPSEFVDIFPTLCDLAGVSIPSHLDGKSLVPLMRNPKSMVKEFSVSQYPRSGEKNETVRLGFADGKCMGYSIRTTRYRYTLWLKDDFRTNRVYDKNLIVATELYDYQKDPNETINVVGDAKYAAATSDLHRKMLTYFEDQRIKLSKK
ncbi:MAG: sulfatase [Bacteroidales bacterium]